MRVETGGTLVDSPRFNRVPPRQVADRAAVYFKSLRKMGYAAMGVGSHEMKLGVKELKKLSRKHKVPLVSANIIDSKTRKPVFQSHVIKQVGALRMCFIGLVSDSPEELGPLFVDKGYEVTSPVAAAKEALKKLKGKRCDLVAVLSQLRRNEVDTLGEKVEGIDLVLGSTNQGLSSSLERVGGAYFGDCFNKGKYVGRLLISPGKDKGRYVIANLRATLQNEKLSLARRVRDIAGQLEEADKPNGAVKLTDDSRRVLQQNLAGLRAKMQRVNLELEEEAEDPGKASLLDLSMHALSSDIKDDKRVLKLVDGYKKRWKVKGAGH